MSSNPPFYIGHTHPSDGRHLTFFAQIKKNIGDNLLSDEVDIKIDIRNKNDNERLENLRKQFAEQCLHAVNAITILENKLAVLDLYIDAFNGLLTELKAFYDDGIKTSATEDRPGTSYNIQDVKVDYWLNWDLRFVHQATHTFDSTPVSVGLGILSALLVSPSILVTFLLQLLPIKLIFSHDGEDIREANLLVEKRRFLDNFINEPSIAKNTELKEAIQSRRPT